MFVALSDQLARCDLLVGQHGPGWFLSRARWGDRLTDEIRSLESRCLPTNRPFRARRFALEREASRRCSVAAVRRRRRARGSEPRSLRPGPPFRLQRAESVLPQPRRLSWKGRRPHRVRRARRSRCDHPSKPETPCRLPCLCWNDGFERRMLAGLAAELYHLRRSIIHPLLPQVSLMRMLPSPRAFAIQAFASTSSLTPNSIST